MAHKLAGTAGSWADYEYWKRSDPVICSRIDRLVDETLRDPYTGLGDPQPLVEDLAGFWSRRIDRENRLVYAVDENKLTILSCRYHHD